MSAQKRYLLPTFHCVRDINRSSLIQGLIRSPSPNVVFLDDDGRAGVKDYGNVSVVDPFQKANLINQVTYLFGERFSLFDCEWREEGTLSGRYGHSRYTEIHPI